MADSVGRIEVRVTLGPRTFTIALDPAHLLRRTAGDLVTAEIVSVSTSNEGENYGA